jgi:lipoprotein NlpI
MKLAWFIVVLPALAAPLAGLACSDVRECAEAARDAERDARYGDAAEALSRLMELEGPSPERLQQRGELWFKAGAVERSIADFDQVIALRPNFEPHHWQRGISHYYAEMFAEGKKQFELHQTVNPNDVENGVWHFLCAARAESVEQARAAMLPVSGDPRAPMTEIYELFRGEAGPEEVLAAARGGQAQFYAHLYLGLYHEALGDAETSRRHIETAVEEYPVSHYMWHVARVHRMLRAGPR